MFTIGAHLSSSKGFLAMGKEALRIGANTFQFFTRNPRGGAAKPLDQADIDGYIAFAKEHGIGPVMGHASYVLNPASPTAQLDEFVRPTMRDDLDRMERIPGSLYNFHPGNRKDNDVETACGIIAETLNLVLKPKQATIVCLETMAGKGGEVGGVFEELALIIDKVKHKKHLGVCLDTCHVFDAGYDIVDDLDGVLARFDKTLGLDRLKAIHLNDSKNPFGSRKDRHETIGGGSIGSRGFAGVINHPALRHLPFFLETPNDNDGYAKEIALLKTLRED